jgi:hypothetical protein
MTLGSTYSEKTNGHPTDLPQCPEAFLQISSIAEHRRMSPSHCARATCAAIGGPPAAIAACLLVILGAKLWLISAAGSITPYWDQ